MKLKKNLVQLVETDYAPLQTDKEGRLFGGFGSMTGSNGTNSTTTPSINGFICVNASKCLTDPDPSATPST